MRARPSFGRVPTVAPMAFRAAGAGGDVPAEPGYRPFWHDRCVPATPSPAEDFGAWPQSAEPAARRRRRGADEPGPNRPGGDGHHPPEDPRSGDDSSAEPPPPLPPVRRLISLGGAGFAALVAMALIVGAQSRHESYAVVMFGVQSLFVAVWVMASRPPAPRVVGTVGLAVALGTDAAAVFTRPASLAPLAYVTAAGFIIGVVGQLTRPAGRQRVTESLGSSLVVTLGVVSFASLVVLGRAPHGTQAIV